MLTIHNIERIQGKSLNPIKHIHSVMTYSDKYKILLRDATKPAAYMQEIIIKRKLDKKNRFDRRQWTMIINGLEISLPIKYIQTESKFMEFMTKSFGQTNQ